MPPTIADVARVAGVSTATVSRVLNGNTDVNEALASRVRAAVSELEYRPSRIARSLRTRRTAIWAAAAITVVSGLAVATRMYETHPAADLSNATGN